MHILIIGGAGMLGTKLAARLARDGHLDRTEISRLTLVDVVAPTAPRAPFPIDTANADLTDPGAAEALIAGHPEVIFHLAAIVSGEAEADFEKGYAVNLDGTRALFEAIRGEPDYRPRVVFTSSIAVFGAPFPDRIDDTFLTAPLTSYGTQKAMCELMLADYSRRGILEGIGIRLPTICVRPGRPNKAASGFFSNIIREPLKGEDAILPVEDDVRHWHASPRSAVGFLLRAAELDPRLLGARRTLNMPGLSCTVGEQIAALERIAGPGATARIHRQPDATIRAIVAGWPRDFAPERALALGFRAETSFDEIIRVHIEDELGGTFVA